MTHSFAAQAAAPSPSSPSPPPADSQDADAATEHRPLCVMTLNALDPCGGWGLGVDMVTIASVGAHPVAVACGVYVSDTSRVFNHTALDDDLVTDQARTVLEDMPIAAIKLGFAGSTANLSSIAQICSDYPEIPVISYMPDLSWWQEGDALEEYMDAFAELMLPQTTVLVGNHATLARWLLPDWHSSRAPSPRDIAKAAEAHDVPFVLVTGIPVPGDYLDNALATTEAILTHSQFELFREQFLGTGDTISAALTALLAAGNDLAQSVQEALEYMDHSLGHAFRPGMGRWIPDRMFWAQPEAENDSDGDGDGDGDGDTTDPDSANAFDDPATPPSESAASDDPDASDHRPPPAGFAISSNDTEH